MARYTDAVCRLCRREGQKLFLKGDRCYGDKCAMERRSYPPGQHGQGRSKNSEYGQQMREKQKAKRYYGILESQFRGYFEMAATPSRTDRRESAEQFWSADLTTWFIVSASP
jgi:small subunit ribosomal protein S4